ncbi:uncharacterized protein LOC119269648 isoform X2 [Triticum dicoccoides]|uniref:uncharacterized protein LOC119269648 isoform X2 n=1 Tax=Triticum dicoccoides TaxID=85692 RepID=UPI0018900ACE|nr:uncharacterized protein LOC119269648 isoform X2 [Triticum dicoccoides]
MADPAAAAAPMTIDFLRARLLSERSVSRASKERADQLAARVAELEEQVRAVTAQRRQAEREAAEVLAVLESRGFCGSLSDVLDSGSDDAEEEERDEPCDATVTGGDPAPRSHGEEGPEQEQEQPPAKGERKEEEDATSGTALQPGGLSWKGRCASPRRARQLKQRHRRSYVYFLASQSDPSPKYRMGQSCRKNKRKELSVAAVVAESRKEQRDGPRCADDDGRTEFDGEVGGDDRRSSGDGGGQYVMRRDDGDGEMERVLEKQAELIGQYEAEEKAQTDWEKKFNDTGSSPNKGDVEADCHLQTKSGGEKLVVSRPPKNSSEEMAPTPAISAQGSSSYSTATRRSQDQQGDANSDGCSSRYTTSASSSGLGAVKAPSESSPSVSKVSDWSSSRFHDHADDQQGNIDVESVLQALQRARISLRQKLDRPLPPSQVTLALPAPGDEYRTDLYNDDDDGSSSYRDGHVGSSPSRQEILALPAPEDYHGYHDHGSANCSTDGADTALTENPSPPQQEILALPAPGDDDGDGEDEVKAPVGSPGLFRLPTDSFPKDETLPAISNGHDAELRSIEVVAARHDTYRDDDGAGVSASAKQLYDPPTSGRCNVPPGSGFVSGIPGLPEDLRKGGGPLGDADPFMQPRLHDYTISNKLML